MPNKNLSLNSTNHNTFYKLILQEREEAHYRKHNTARDSIPVPGNNNANP